MTVAYVNTKILCLIPDGTKESIYIYIYIHAYHNFQCYFLMQIDNLKTKLANNFFEFCESLNRLDDFYEQDIFGPTSAFV